MEMFGSAAAHGRSWVHPRVKVGGVVVRMLIVTVGGLGRMRPAPGTWGSLPPCMAVLLLVLANVGTVYIQAALIALILLSGIACIALGRWAEHKFQTKDPGVMVVDEVAGMSVALLFIPLQPLGTGATAGGAVDVHLGAAMLAIGAAFFLFRIFDIIKVPPANLMEQFPAGWGILLDDLLVGLYANLVLQVFLRLALPWLAGHTA